ncbi:MAG: alpha/beta hydrolase [Verrucomicrobiales bacterium]
MWKQALWSVARIVGGLSAGLAILILGCQERLIYFPRAYAPNTIRSFLKTGGRQIDFKTSCGGQTAFYLPPRRPATEKALPDHVWLVFGGNATLALDLIDLAEQWNPRHGWLFIDYPSYGGCEGKPSPESIRENALAAVAALERELDVSREELAPRLGAFGHSLGSAAALLAAEALGIRRIVLVSAFTSMDDLGRHLYKVPLSWINRHRFDNVARLKSVRQRGARLHIFHGTDDEIVPFRMGRQLAATAPEIATFHAVRGADHNGILMTASAEIGAAINALSGQ